ncbi:MAG TPA: ABC transporter permease [Gaiellaceae bacterium]|jgi:peptide/nickel transport system permease protein
MASVETQAVTAARPVHSRRSSTRLWPRLLRQPAALVSGFVLIAIFVIGAIEPQITPTSASRIHLGSQFIDNPPAFSLSWHILGTDGIGRLVLVRTLEGLHTSEQSALAATLIATLIGVAIGGFSGYRGGSADAMLMRFADMLGIFPALLLLLAAYTYFTPVTVPKASLILACYLWIPVARVVRAEITTLRDREFVQAARSLGASDRRIFFRHLLPNASATIIIAATTLLGQVIMIEALIEFFGLGVPAEITPTLGNLIGDGQRNVLALAWGWWTWAGPAVLLVIILVCANLLGDGVADALRPQRQR